MLYYSFLTLFVAVYFCYVIVLSFIYYLRVEKENHLLSLLRGRQVGRQDHFGVSYFSNGVIKYENKLYKQ